MALCDRLEAARAEREATRDRLTAASLARLNAPDPDPATFATHARFALDNLPALTTRPDQIKQLRQTILNLAVRGKLVPQDPTDEPASELLRRIAGGWTPELRANKMLEIFPEPSIGWDWALIDHCFQVTGGIQKTPARAPRGNAFPYLGVGNVYRNRLKLTDIKQFELVAGELERYCLKPNDIMVVEGNGSVTRDWTLRDLASPNPKLRPSESFDPLPAQRGAVGAIHPDLPELSGWHGCNETARYNLRRAL